MKLCPSFRISPPNSFHPFWNNNNKNNICLLHVLLKKWHLWASYPSLIPTLPSPSPGFAPTGSRPVPGKCHGPLGPTAGRTGGGSRRAHGEEFRLEMMKYLFRIRHYVILNVDVINQLWINYVQKYEHLDIVIGRRFLRLHRIPSPLSKPTLRCFVKVIFVDFVCAKPAAGCNL